MLTMQINDFHKKQTEKNELVTRPDEVSACLRGISALASSGSWVLMTEWVGTKRGLAPTTNIFEAEGALVFFLAPALGTSDLETK